MTYRLYARRKPTPEEIRFGYGCSHYSYFTKEVLGRIPKRFRWLGNTWVVVSAQLTSKPTEVEA